MDTVSPLSRQALPDDPVSEKFIALLRDFLTGLKERNGGFGKIEIEVAHGEIKRFGAVYEPYLLSKTL